jgi:GTP cyclohydrolase FolE2
MDVKQLKDISDRSYRIAVEKKNALEKAKTSMILAYSGHLFQADAQTINLVHVLKNKLEKFVILDSNQNPMMVEDADDFLDKLTEKQQEALNTYYQSYNDSVTKG